MLFGRVLSQEPNFTLFIYLFIYTYAYIPWGYQGLQGAPRRSYPITLAIFLFTLINYF